MTPDKQIIVGKPGLTKIASQAPTSLPMEREPPRTSQKQQQLTHHSQALSVERPISQVTELVEAEHAQNVMDRKFSLVPFAKENSNAGTSESRSPSKHGGTHTPMERVNEEVKVPLGEDDDDDEYEDDQDFEPFETSKKDFNVAEESKNVINPEHRLSRVSSRQSNNGRPPVLV